MKVQQRNRYMKLAGLTRDFVRMRYVQGEATHTARQTGADMIMLGSGGDTNLKEKALGHAGIYGHDALERYGPALLKAWKSILGATELNAPNPLPRKPRNKPVLTGGGTLFRIVKSD